MHRDVKPDNILLREDGTSAVLTDFGIARANDSATRMTRTGAVVGTPHYMSPEQARGKALDGRSDLYSLGIVLYELLVGRVPLPRGGLLAVGIMHITQPVPQLPPDLAPLQSLLDRLLANNRRIASRTAPPSVQQRSPPLERRIGRGSFRSGAAPGGVAEPARRRAEPRQRAEPSLGRLDDIAAAVGRERLRSEGPTRGAAAGAWALVFAAVRCSCWLSAACWPGATRIACARAAAYRAQRSARPRRPGRPGGPTPAARPTARGPLYEAARAIDADNDLARACVASARRCWRRRAKRRPK